MKYNISSNVINSTLKVEKQPVMLTKTGRLQKPLPKVAAFDKAVLFVYVYQDQFFPSGK